MEEYGAIWKDIGPSMAVPTPFGCVGCKLRDQKYSPAVVTVLSCLIFIIIVVDLVGNFLVILAVFKNRKLRNSGNMFVASLSVANMLVALYPYPLMMRAMDIGGWNLSHVQCQAFGFITALTVVGSVFNIMAIAINRYCYICHSLQYERIFSMRNTAIYLAITWIMTILAILPSTYIGTIEYDPRTYSCIYTYVDNPTFVVTIICIHYALPVFLVGACYMRIWVRVLRVRNATEWDPEHQLAQIHHFLTMFVIYLLFTFCWCPVNAVNILVAFNSKEIAAKIPNWLYLTVYFVGYCNSCFSSLIYGLINETFRREYWVMFSVMRHPIRFISGLFSQLPERWPTPAPDGFLSRISARASYEVREPANARPAVQEIPMRVFSVPLPGDAAAGQPECVSAYRKSVCGHKAVFSPSKLASDHPKSATVFSKPVSVHFKADSVRFIPASSDPMPVTDHHISAGSHSKSALSATTSSPTALPGHIKPLTCLREPTTADEPKPATTSHLELTASCYPETTATDQLECDITDLPAPPSSPATRTPEPPASLLEPAPDPFDPTQFTTDTRDIFEFLTIDFDVDSD